jgi:putative hydrolase
MMKIIADLHTHTLASGHGIDTIRTLADFAVRKNLKGIAITDHGPGIAGGPDPIYFMSLKRMTQGIDLPIRIFYGVEDDIRNRKGDLTLPEYILKDMEIVLTGLHPFTWIADQASGARTEAVINAMGKGIVQAFSHPVGTYYEIDLDPVLDAAVVHKVAMELNATKLGNRELVTDYLERCAHRGAAVVVNSDAHLGEEVGGFHEAMQLLKDVGFPENLVVNRSREAVAAFFGITW